MTQRVFVGLLTVAVFLAGYFTRAVTAHVDPVPPPPAALARELAPKTSKGDSKSRHEVDRSKVVEDIQKLRSQIDAYMAQVQDIEGEFDREFNAVLNPKQREKRAAYLKTRAEKEAKRVADREPLPDEAIARERERPLTDIYWNVTVAPRLDRLIKEYELTDEQQTKTRTLLAARRNKYMALYEATPHPSLRLTRLAPMIERVRPLAARAK